MLSIISTVGTTVFGKYESLLATKVRELERENLSNADIAKIQRGRCEQAEPLYQQALADLKAKAGEFLRRATAEINAIEGIHDLKGARTGNEYYFIASNTASGVLAARVLADFCVEHYNAAYAEAIIIQGLQVKDPRAFRLTGLPILVQKLYELMDDAKKKHLSVILNPTGGFKAAIPYITLVGMLRQSQDVQVSLIHETSTELITLANLPITLDISQIEKIRPLLEACEKEQQSGVDQNQMKQELGLNRNQMVEDHPLWSLFEQLDGDHYTLSGLGTIALAELRARSQMQTVWLSKQAYERLEREFKPGSEARRNFETIFDRLRDPAKRVDPYRHAYKDCDFPAYKYKGNERLFYHERPDGTVLVLELAQHISDSDWSYDRVPDEQSEYIPYFQWK